MRVPRVFGLFWLIFDFKLEGLYTLSILPPKDLNRKSAQKNRKIDRTSLCTHPLRLFLLLFAFSLFAHPPIEIVYHVATIKSWEGIVQEQLQTLESTNLAKEADRITITVVGPDIKKVEALVEKTPYSSKVRLIHFSDNPRYCEFPGIEIVQEIAKEKPDSNILYFHSKGVTYSDPDKSRNVASWRRFMEYFTMNCWEECMEALKTSKMCSVEWLNSIHTSSQKIEQPGFYAGNFWWARADYLRTCAPMIGTPQGPEWCFKHRFDCEVFVGTGLNPTSTSLYQSGVNLYEFNYSPEYYQKEPVLEDPIEIIYHIVAEEQWQSSFQEQLKILHTSGLLESCNRLTAIVLGPEIKSIQQDLERSPYYSKMRIIYANSHLHLGEFPSIEMAKTIANRQPNAKICYLHNHTLDPFIKPSRSIGDAIYKAYLQTRKNLSQSFKRWKNNLLGKVSPTNLTISRWKECVSALQTANLCGMKWKRERPKGSHFPDIFCHGHFSDHSWWATAQHLRGCQNPHFRSSYSLYHHQWSRAWLRQYFADSHMFVGTSHNEPIVHDLYLN